MITLYVAQKRHWGRPSASSSASVRAFELTCSFRQYKSLLDLQPVLIPGDDKNINLRLGFYVQFQKDSILMKIEPDDEIGAIYNPAKHKKGNTAAQQTPQINLECSQSLFEHLQDSSILASSISIQTIATTVLVIPKSDVLPWKSVQMMWEPENNLGTSNSDRLPSADYVRAQINNLAFKPNCKIPIMMKSGEVKVFTLLGSSGDVNTQEWGFVAPSTNLTLSANPTAQQNRITSTQEEESEIDETESIRSLLEQAKRSPQEASRIWLIHGPPGTGKTYLVHALALEMGYKLQKATISDLFASTVSNPFDQLLQDIVGGASKSCEIENDERVILFFDDIDILLSSDEVSDLESQRKFQIQFCQLVADLKTLQEGKTTKNVVLIGCTSHIEALNTNIRKNFEREILLEAPSQAQRKKLLKSILCKYMRGHMDKSTWPDLSRDDIDEVAANCHGYSIADLEILARVAITHAVLRTREDPCGGGDLDRELVEKESGGQHEITTGEVCKTRWSPEIDNSDSEEETIEDHASTPASPVLTSELSDIQFGLQLTKVDLEFARTKTRPESLASQITSVPTLTTKFSSIGGLENEIKQLIQSTVWIYKYREKFMQMGIHLPRGILVFGPPGTGKTLLAKAVAAESKANFVSVSSVDLIKGEIGASEKAISELFRVARQTAPCIIFLDEIQAMFGSRDSSGAHGKNMISQLALEMDGMVLSPDVVVIAATNRPDWIDTSLLRPGRFDRCLYIPPPTLRSRASILSITIQKMLVSQDVNEEFINEIATKTHLFTGADLTNLCMKAAWNSLKDSLRITQADPADPEPIKPIHFRTALSEFSPTVTLGMLAQYERFQAKYGRQNQQPEPKPTSAFDLPNPDRPILSRMDQVKQDRLMDQKQREEAKRIAKRQNY